ncbi:MAG: pilin [bacterium]
MISKSVRRGFGFRVMSAFAGLLVGFNLSVLLLFALAPTAEASGLTCTGNYGCFSQAACERSDGDFVACPERCDTEGRSGRGYCYARPMPVRLSVRIGSLSVVDDLAQYVENAYRYSIGLAAVLAAVMIMVGGVQWMTAADSGRAGKARDRIVNSTVGLLLVIFAYVILNTINPALVRLQMPRVPLVRPEAFVRCELFRMQYACGQRFGIVEREDVPADATEAQRFEVVADINAPGVIAECVGGSCGMAGFDEGTVSCQPQSGAAAPATGTPAASSGSVGGVSEAGIGSGEGVATGGGVSPVGQVGAGYECRACTTNGNACQGLGPCPSCCGGYCGATDESVSSTDSRTVGGTVLEQASNALGTGLPGVCSSGMNGVKCGSAAECRGGRCVDVSDYWQGLLPVTNFVSGAWDILAGAVGLNAERVVRGSRGINPTISLQNIWAGGICSNGAVGAPCNTDGDCGGGMVCLDDFGVHVCSRPIAGGYCSEDRHCGTGLRCMVEAGVCMIDAERGNGCRADSDCEATFGAGFKCRNAILDGGYMCTNGEDGSLCSNDSQCNSRHCYNGAIVDVGEPEIGLCVSGNDGSGCDGPEDCNSGVCYNHDGYGLLCVGPQLEVGAPCVSGQDTRQCGNGLVCSQSSQTCVTSGGVSAGSGAVVR